jgi:hypothetical protein
VGRDGERYIADLGQAKTEIFLQIGLDSQFTDLPVGGWVSIRSLLDAVENNFLKLVAMR